MWAQGTQRVPLEPGATESKKRDKGPQLAKLMMQPKGPPAPGGRCGNPYIAYWDFQERFEEFLAGAALPIEVFPHNGSRTVFETGRWTHSAKGDWLDRLEGGPGCWAAKSGLDPVTDATTTNCESN